MDDRMQTAMAEATRLTRAGQLTEATAIIQRALRGESTTHVSEDVRSSAAEPIEAEFNIVDSLPSIKTPIGNTAAQTEAVPVSGIRNSASVLDALSPDALRLPGGMRFTRGGIRPMGSEGVSSSVLAGGQFVDRTNTNSAGARAYKLYVPSGYVGQTLPLVVMLHGCTQASLDFASGTAMNVHAEKGMFFVAYPEQVQSANSSGCWNWFQIVNQQRGKGEPSLIAGITQQIMQEYSIDANRVYVAGLSSGGAMAAIMAATYPDLYAAVGVHSGLAYGAAHDLPSAFTAMKKGASQQTRRLTAFVPMIVFHGDRDTTVSPINADDLVDQWLAAAENGTDRSIRSSHGVVTERGQVVDGHTYRRFIYRNRSGRTLVEKWIIHQANHAWSGGNVSGSYTDPKGPDASAAMIRFFTEHSRGG